MWVVTTILDSTLTISHVRLHTDKGMKINYLKIVSFYLFSPQNSEKNLITQTLIC